MKLIPINLKDLLKVKVEITSNKQPHRVLTNRFYELMAISQQVEACQPRHHKNHCSKFSFERNCKTECDTDWVGEDEADCGSWAGCEWQHEGSMEFEEIQECKEDKKPMWHKMSLVWVWKKIGSGNWKKIGLSLAKEIRDCKRLKKVSHGWGMRWV